MNNVNTLTLELSGPRETRALGMAMGEKLWPGCVLYLYGDLGTGKTCFCQGLARGLGVPENVAVTSPTYTLINAYEGRIPFFHADLYRLEAGEDLENIGLFECSESRGVLAIEWADRILDNDPPPDLCISFTTPMRQTRLLEIKTTGQGGDDLVNTLTLEFSDLQKVAGPNNAN